MVVKLHNIDFPEDAVLRSMFNWNRQVSAVVEATEFRGHDWSVVCCTSDGFLDGWLCDRFEEWGGLAANALALLQGRLAWGCDGLFSVFNRGDGNDSFLFETLHVLGWKISKCWVLRLREHLVVWEFPGFALSHGQDFLKVVLYNHAWSVIDLGHAGRCTCHEFNYKYLFKCLAGSLVSEALAILNSRQLANISSTGSSTLRSASSVARFIRSGSIASWAFHNTLTATCLELSKPTVFEASEL